MRDRTKECTIEALKEIYFWREANILLWYQLARKKYHVINANIKNANPTREGALKTGHSALKMECTKRRQEESLHLLSVPASVFWVGGWGGVSPPRRSPSSGGTWFLYPLCGFRGRLRELILGTPKDPLYGLNLPAAAPGCSRGFLYYFW